MSFPRLFYQCGKCGIPVSALIVVGHEHRLADPDSLAKMMEAMEIATAHG